MTTHRRLLVAFRRAVVVATAIASVSGAAGAAGVGATTPPGDAPNTEMIVGDRLTATVIDVGGDLDSLSPDGRWIAGVDAAGRPCVWDVATLKPTCADGLVELAEFRAAPSMRWSPDSSAVTFTSDLLSARREPDVMVLTTGGTLTNLTDDGVGDEAVDDLGATNAAIDLVPVFTSDGQTIHFARSEVGSPERRTVIMAVGSTGGPAVELAEAPVPKRLAVYQPMYTRPDGSTVVAVSTNDPAIDGSGIYVLSASGKLDLVHPDDPLVDGRGGLAQTLISAVGADGIVHAVNVASMGVSSSEDVGPVAWEVDPISGSATPAPALDATTGELVATPVKVSSTTAESGLARQFGPTGVSSDGGLRLAPYLTEQPRLRALVLTDGDDRVVGSLDLLDPAVANAFVTGPTIPQFADDGTVMLRGFAGKAVLLSVDTRG